MSAAAAAGSPPGGARPTSGAARQAEETRERFLREIVARVPAERVDECFLFPPIRQGGAESGIAVLAVRQRAEDVTAGDDATLVDVTPAGDPTEAAAGDDRAPDADREPSVGEASDAGAAAPPERPERPERPAAPEPPARERHIVYVARYRLSVKGPDRGRWEMEVREEADAPLVTVEEVVRGVGRRAGDAAEPTRLDRDAVARLVGAAPGASSAAG